MSRDQARSHYSIASVSKLTGVSCHALRVWERRYGFPSPVRSPSGHRRYPAEQVEVLREIAAQVHSGRPIGAVISEHRASAVEPRPACAREDAPDLAPIQELLDRLFVGDFVAADAVYDRLASRRTPVELIAGLIRPALVDSGERWFRKECDAFQERCASGFLLRKLSVLFEQLQRANPRPVHLALVGSVQGDRHEGGILSLASVLEWHGWRAISLGADVPVREFQQAITLWKPDALALSFTLSRNIKKRFAELKALNGVPIIVGGRSILNYQGLARRHGLLALPGSAEDLVGEFLARFEQDRPKNNQWINGHA